MYSKVLREMFLRRKAIAEEKDDFVQDAYRAIVRYANAVRRMEAFDRKTAVFCA